MVLAPYKDHQRCPVWAEGNGPAFWIHVQHALIAQGGDACAGGELTQASSHCRWIKKMVPAGMPISLELLPQQCLTCLPYERRQMACIVVNLQGWSSLSIRFRDTTVKGYVTECMECKWQGRCLGDRIPLQLMFKA